MRLNQSRSYFCKREEQWWNSAWENGVPCGENRKRVCKRQSNFNLYSQIYRHYVHKQDYVKNTCTDGRKKGTRGSWQKRDSRRTSKQKAHLFMDVVRESKPVPSDCDNWESSAGRGRTHPLDLLVASMGCGWDALVFLLIMVVVMFVRLQRKECVRFYSWDDVTWMCSFVLFVFLHWRMDRRPWSESCLLACLRCRWQGLFAILVLCLLHLLTYYYNKPSKLPL